MVHQVCKQVLCVRSREKKREKQEEIGQGWIILLSSRQSKTISQRSYQQASGCTYHLLVLTTKRSKNPLGDCDRTTRKGFTDTQSEADKIGRAQDCTNTLLTFLSCQTFQIAAIYVVLRGGRETRIPSKMWIVVSV